MLPPDEHLRTLKDRAAGIPSRQDSLNRARALRFTQLGFDRAVWRQMCAKGWLGLRVPKEAGGSGRNVRAWCRRVEELGAVLTPEPLITATMAAMLLPATHLPEVLSGARIVLPAWQEAPDSLALTSATELRAGRLTGRKRAIPMAAGADAFLVTVPGGLALVERDAPGLTLEIQPTQDGGHLGTLAFDGTPAEALDGDATDVLDQTIVATAAYLLGLITSVPATPSGADLPPPAAAAERYRNDRQVQIALTRAVVEAAAAAMDTEQRRTARQAAASRAMMRAADAAMTVTTGWARLYRGAEADLFRCKAVVVGALYGGASVHRARCEVAARS